MRLRLVVYVSVLFTMDLISVLNIIPAIIGAVGAIGGSVIGSLMSKNSAKSAQDMSIKGIREQNAAQLQIARENREFERDVAYEMMQKRHQWEVDDLRAAGLNPILSSHGTPSMGNVGADTPPLRSETEQAAEYEYEIGKIHASTAQQIISNLLALRQQKNNDVVAQAQAANFSAQAQLHDAERQEVMSKVDSRYWPNASDFNMASAEGQRAYTEHTKTQTRLAEENIKKAASEIRSIEQNIASLKQQINESKTREQEIRARAELNKAEAELTRVKKDTERDFRILQRYSIVKEQLGLPASELESRIMEHGGSALDFYEDLMEWVVNGMQVEINVPPGTRPNTRGERGTGGR